MDTTDLEIVAQALRAGWDRRPFSGECFDALERIQDRIAELEVRLQGIATIARETTDLAYCRRLIIDATKP